ncbi:DUF5131 family protein [Nocardia sp. CA-290969]|uniref:DUF5131 family protein n=1 Tax=Nocardia sp. CA-290969 TaxID=3239986 RepID=UPI003D8C0A79
MMTKTSIEWTDETWNPVTGCDKVSPGCDHCYAEGIANRFAGTPQFPNGFAVTLHPERLTHPLRWKKPRRVFVNSMSDLFHDQISDRYIAQVWAIMAATPQHTYQVLTKRHGRMRSLLSSTEFDLAVAEEWTKLGTTAGSVREDHTPPYPLPNVWLGVSAEDQRWADIRIPALLDTPAAVRFVSAEPLLGPIDLDGPLDQTGAHRPKLTYWLTGRPGFAEDGTLTTGPRLDWVIVGGESGHGARPMDPVWARSLRDQCTAAGVAYLFKQWGEWVPTGFGFGQFDPPDYLIGSPVDDLGFRQIVRRVGKKKAGRELDGRTWDQYPGGAE